MRQLSQTQANRCENATTPRCRCRCGGAFHGAARVTKDELGLLARDDPHRAVGVKDPVQLTLEHARDLAADAWGRPSVTIDTADELAEARRRAAIRDRLSGVHGA